jgi:tRNA(Ile)-lysidine synthase
MPAKREHIVRPLLPVWRREIAGYLQRYELPSRVDASNACTKFTRNRVRLELLPQLEADYAPRLRERLVHLALLARQDNQALELLAAFCFTRGCQRLPDGVALRLDAHLPAAITSRIWRQAIAEVRGDLDGISYEHITAIQTLSVGGGIDLPGIRVLHEVDCVVFLSLQTGAAPRSIVDERALSTRGRLDLPEANARLTAEEHTGRLPMMGGDHAVMDAATVQGGMTVRGWRAGDRFRPLGAPGRRKLQDIFVDAGVPRRWRQRIPVIADDEGIIWLAGFRVADRVKVTPTTTHCRHLSIEWEFNPWTLSLSQTAPVLNWEEMFASFAPPDA